MGLYKKKTLHEVCPLAELLSLEEWVELEGIKEDGFISILWVLQWRRLSSLELGKELERRGDLMAGKEEKWQFFGKLFKRHKLASHEEIPQNFTTTEMKELEAQLQYVVEDSVLPENAKLMVLEISVGGLMLALESNSGGASFEAILRRWRPRGPLPSRCPSRVCRTGKRR